MPIKTQMRLAQLTGSLTDTGTESSTLNAASLQGVLDAVAAGVKRITGGTNFHSAKAGSFTHSKFEITGSELEFDSTSGNPTIIAKHSSNPLRFQSEGNNGFMFFSQASANRGLRIQTDNNDHVELRPLENAADIIIGTSTGGNMDEVFRVDGSATSLLMNAGKEIQFGSADDAIGRGASAGVVSIKAGGAGILEIGSAVTASAAVVGDSDYGQDLGSADLNWGELFVGQVNATGLTGSLAGTGITNDQVVVSNNGTLEGTSGLTFNGTTLSSVSGSFSGDLTVTGDLTVNGSTTTVNSTNMTVDDAIILLGQGNNANTKDLGLVLERGGSNIALFLDETDDVFKFQFTTETAADDEITATDGKLAVQVDKLQITGSNSYIELANAGGGEMLNIVSNQPINLDADGGQIFFTDSSVQTTDGVAIEFDMSTDQELKVKSGDSTSTFLTFDSANTRSLLGENLRTDGSKKIEFRDGDASLASATTAGELVYSGSSSLIIANTTVANSGLLKIQKADAFVGFDFDGNTSVTYSWPNAPAANNYVLQAQTNGTLAWVAQGGASNSVKTFATVAATVSSDDNLSTDSGYSTTDYSAIDTANASNAIDVYVNGQLLQSGSGPYSTDVSAGGFTSGDYLADTLNMNALDVKFAFDLEADDVVCIIGRA